MGRRWVRTRGSSWTGLRGLCTVFRSTYTQDYTSFGCLRSTVATRWPALIYRYSHFITLHRVVQKWGHFVRMLTTLNSFDWFVAYDFYRATRMHSAFYAVARCVSVRLSLCQSQAGNLSKRLCISSNFVHHRVAPPFYSVVIQYSDGDLPDWRVECRGYEKTRFSTISLYLRNDAR